MKKFVSFLILMTLALANFPPVFAQQTPSKDDDNVVKISTKSLPSTTLKRTNQAVFQI